MNKNTKKILFIIIGILCVVAIAVSAYFFFSGSNTSTDSGDLLDVYIPQSEPAETVDDTVSGFISSMKIYKLNTDEIKAVEADITSNANWKTYTDADGEITETLTLIMLTSEFEPDFENCYIAFHNYNEGSADMPLSAEIVGGENFITFSSRLIAVYDKSDNTFYLIESIS